jgi:hypothetical protein
MFARPALAVAGFLFGMDDMISKVTELRVLARKHTRTAVATLLGLMTSEKVAPPYRISAANSLFDRGWGRAAQMLASEDGNALGLRITEIVTTIVDPKLDDDSATLVDGTGAVQSGSPEQEVEAISNNPDEAPVEK